VPPAELLDLLHEKVRQGELYKLGEDRFVLRETMASLAQAAARLAGAQESGRFSAAQFRDAVGTNRALAIDILECLDRQRVTVRVGGWRQMARGDAPIVTDAQAIADRRRQHWRHRHRFTPSVPGGSTDMEEQRFR